jgi:hypothetical protein
MSRSGDLSVMVDRPTDIKRLVDFMLGASPAASNIDPERIGFFGFSRGGYTGLVLIGANQDWASDTDFCPQSSFHRCEQIRRKEFPTQPLTHDVRIKTAVIVDPLAVFFTANSFAAVEAPVQLWASEYGRNGVSPESVAAVDRSLPIVYDATEDVSVAIGRHGLKEIASDNLAARRDLRGTERLCTGDHIRQVVEHPTQLWDCREDPSEERAMTAAHVDDSFEAREVVCGENCRQSLRRSRRHRVIEYRSILGVRLYPLKQPLTV